VLTLCTIDPTVVMILMMDTGPSRRAAGQCAWANANTTTDSECLGHELNDKPHPNPQQA
jgi:hypothetical protein